MKNKLLLLGFLVLMTCAFTACDNNGERLGTKPILYVVNGSDYSVDVYCDNYLVASTGAHSNSGKVVLTNTSINLPVFVEALYFDKKGNQVFKLTWNDYIFKWDTSYKMTLQNKKGQIQMY